MSKYQSEIINEILGQRGHELSTLHYQSECIETWIEEAKGAYPKLCDYQSEWLNYITVNPIGSFPYESITDVTNATINNAVPYAYKSAILKGGTLVNCINQKDFIPIYATRVEIDNGYAYTQNGYNNSTRIELDYTSNPLLSNEKYYLISFRLKINKQRTVNVTTDGSGYEGYIQRFSENADIFIKAKIKFGTDGTKLRIYVRCEDNLDYTDDTFEIRDLMLIEYQDGMENWDIPYFEGMQSVKMPVLTTYNQGNLFKNYVQDGSQWGKDYNCVTTDVKYSQNGSYINLKSKNSLCYTGFVSPLLSQGTYKFTCKIKVGSVGDSYRILIHGNPNSAKNDNRGFASDKIVSTQEIETFEYVGYFNEANNMLFYAYRNGQEIKYYDIIFTKLSDEDVTNDIEKYNYKTNILTVNEDVELRGIGEVKDELDLITGELTQRIGETVLDGSQSVMGAGYIKLDNAISDWSGNDKYLLSDKLPTSIFTGSDLSTTPTLALHGALLYVRGVNSNEEITEYFRNNPTTVQYRLAKESIKTVDLKTVNESGESVKFIPLEGTIHLSTDGESVKPLFNGEVPVEAISQNLSSFIEE